MGLSGSPTVRRGHRSAATDRTGLQEPVGLHGGRSRRLIATLAAATLAALCACSPTNEHSAPVDSPMPVEQEWFAARANAQRQGVENLVPFYSEDVTLDHRALGPEVVRGREDSLRLIERRWSRDILVRQLQGDPYLSVDAALTHEYLYVGGPGFRNQVVMRTTFGPDSATSESLAVSESGWRRDDPTDRRLHPIDMLVRSYAAAWSTGDVAATRALYADGARIEDSLLGITASAIAVDELVGMPLAGGGLPGMQVAQLPDFDGPAVFVAASTMNDLPIDEFGVILTTPEDAGCPQDVAVWLTLDADGRIESESRFHQLDDLASCASGVAVPAGWWETLPVPDPIRTIPTGTLQVAGQSIDMYNSSAELDALVAWGFGRFASAGLQAPTIQRITFYPGHVDRCEGVTGLIASDAIVYCFTSTTNCTGTECDAWEVWKRATVLHELGHAWLSANLTGAVRDDFLHRADLRAWSSAPEWGDRGVELAAETLAWGLVDEPYEVRRPLGTWECAELADLFEVLTGAPPDPMPVCPDGG